jgi:hypothetical protein
MVDVTLTQRMREILSEAAPQANGGADADSLLFLGNWHDSIPRALTLDPILEAVDVRVYLLIRTVLSARGVSRFPSYDEIQRLLNLSRATVARSILILRASRWISLCNCLRDEAGRFKGNVYAVHDEVLTLSDAVALDGHYIEFLEGIENHHHNRVGLVAHAVLETIRHQVRRRDDVGVSYSPLIRFGCGSERLLAANPEQISRLNTAHDSCDAVQNLNSEVAGKNLNLETSGPVQNLNSPEKQIENQQVNDQEKNLNSAVCSSSFINIKTTTANNIWDNSEKSESAREASARRLIFPSDLSPDECRLARDYLLTLPTADHQDLLDELAAQMLAKRNTDKPIRNALGYLHWMCERLSEGHRPLTSCGIKFRQLREREQRKSARDQQQKQAIRQASANVSKDPLVQQLLAIQAQQAAQGGTHD